MLLAAFPTPSLSPIEDVARWAFDRQMRAIQGAHPRPLDQDVVLIGIDEGTYSAYDEPFALWHKHFGSMLRALARARPRAIALDTVLPERSYDFILKGSDLALMQGLALLKNAQVPFVYVQTQADSKRLATIQPNLVAYLTPDNFGLDQQTPDADLTSRSFFYATFDQSTGKPVPTLASQVLRQVNIPFKEGYIDYSLGAPLEYVPMQAVEKMTDAQLHKAFGNRIVFVGSLIGGTDRWRLPTRLLAHDPGRARDDYDQPGVLIHAQIVRNHLSTGMLHAISPELTWLAMAIAATAVFISASPAIVIGAAVAAPILVVGAGLASIVSTQAILPLAAIIITFWIALLVRGLFDAIE
ncbi:MAG TPA: CHASE2 domain-containing protein, partial [Usitatibacter sp.]